MLDKICIKDLECFGYHGVLKEEQTLGQKFLVSLTLFLDTRLAGEKDDLEATINYGEVCINVQDFMKNNKFLLIERVADELAKMLLLKYHILKKVTVIIKKPWAPIHFSLDTVSIEITRGWHQVFLGLGANLGDKKENIKKAIESFSEHPLCCVEKVSSFIETKPYGVKEQDTFINGVILLKTMLSPNQLLGLIGQVENNLNRIRITHWGPRTIDVDILLYDDLIIAEENLQIPHIEMYKRDFVLQPLVEIAPYAFHPIKKKNVKELWEELQNRTDYEETIGK
ncbi:MAG: 2-amino-4-hydroxy-6-hydroxymethyldihydropteridine diphosphokinase [Lachnospiraceae bacterium]|nr:2-amino-4-hydroxy-6-hydroxymethyldihydropteridine diphosphokinase [Lachnospiraceae bacterium]